MYKSFTILLLLAALCAALAATADKDMSNLERSQKILELDTEAQEDMANGAYKSAAKLYSTMAELAPTRREKAILLLKAADAFFKAEKGHRALEEYTRLLEDYPLFIPYGYVVSQMRQLAEDFVIGEKTTLWFKDIPKAIKIYETIIREAPAEHISRSDRFRLAELLCLEERDEEAVTVYQAVIKQNTRDWEARAKLGLLLGKLAKISDGDGAKTRAAVREAKLVLAYQPELPQADELSKLLVDAKNLNAKRLLEQAEFYLNPAHKRLHAARRYLHDVIAKFPGTTYAQSAKDHLINNPQLAQLELEITNPELARQRAEQAKGPKPVFNPKQPPVKDNAIAFEPRQTAPKDQPAFQPIEPKKDGEPALSPQFANANKQPALPRRPQDPLPEESSLNPTTEESSKVTEEEKTQPTKEEKPQPTEEEKTQPTEEEKTQPTEEAEVPSVKPLFAPRQSISGNLPAFQPIQAATPEAPVFTAIPSVDSDTPAFNPVPIRQDGVPAFQAHPNGSPAGPALERRHEDTLPYVKINAKPSTEPEGKAEPAPVKAADDVLDAVQEQGAVRPLFEALPSNRGERPVFQAITPSSPEAPVFPFIRPSQSDAPALPRIQPRQDDAPALPSRTVTPADAAPALERRNTDTLPCVAAPVSQNGTEQEGQPAAAVTKPVFEARVPKTADSPFFEPLQSVHAEDRPIFPLLPNFDVMESIFEPGVMRQPRHSLNIPQSPLQQPVCEPAFSTGAMLSPADSPQYK